MEWTQHMKPLFAVASLILGFATSAAAYDTVVCFADSIANYPSAGDNYCSRLQQLRPEMNVVNRSANGRNTVQALAQVAAVVDEACGSTSCLVLVHHGVNDMMLPEVDALETAKRLRSIRSRVRGAGRDVWLLTPLPFLSPDPAQNEFARDVGNATIALARRNATVFDARDVFSLSGWTAYTLDGVHPNVSGAAAIAAALASEIP